MISFEKTSPAFCAGETSSYARLSGKPAAGGAAESVVNDSGVPCRDPTSLDAVTRKWYSVPAVRPERLTLDVTELVPLPMSIGVDGAVCVPLPKELPSLTKSASVMYWNWTLVSDPDGLTCALRSRRPASRA